MKTLSMDSSIYGTGSIFALERKFNELFEGKMYSLTVCNATMGIMAGLIAAGIKKNDPVIVTPYSWGGTIAAAMFLDCHLIFADIHPSNLTIYPESVEEILSNVKGVKAIIDADTYGNPAWSETIKQEAEKHNVIYIQDCASSLGARINGHQSGYYSDLCVFSFGEMKSLNAGEGGIICTPHEDLYKKLIHQFQHPERARRDLPGKQENQFGLNLRMNPLAARKILAKWDETFKKIESRRQKAELIIDELLEWSPCPEHLEPSFHRLVFIYDERSSNLRFKTSPVPYGSLLFEDPVFRNNYRNWQSFCTPITSAYISKLVNIIL